MRAALAAVAAISVIAGVIATTRPAQAPEVEQPNLVRINDNPGGVVDDFLQLRDDWRQAGTRVEISGACNSACTLFLDLPNVCVHLNARLGFHAPYWPVKPGVYAYFDDYTTEFMGHYPKPVQDWITAHGGLTYDLIILEGADLRKMVPACPLF